MKTSRLVLISVAVLVLVGCAYKGPKTDPGQGSTTLANTYWKLLTVEGDTIITPADAREAHIILRPDYRVTGFGGCNAFNGTWQMEEDQLVVGPLMSTKMSCPQMNTEQALLSALDGPVIADIEGDILNIMGREGVELTFRAMYFR